MCQHALTLKKEVIRMKKYIQKFLAGLAALPLAAQCLAPIHTEASLITVEFRTSNLTQISAARYDSNWANLVSMGLSGSSEKSCAMDLSSLYATAIAHAGAYAPLVEQLFAAVEEETLSCSGSVFTLSASLPNLHCLLVNAEGVTMQEQLTALAETYAASEDAAALMQVDAAALEQPCTLEIRADFSNVETTGAVGLTYAVTTDGSSYTLLGEDSIFAHLAEVYAAYADAVIAATDASSAALQADVDAVLSSYADVLERLQVSDDSLTQQLTVSGESLADVLAQLEAANPNAAGMLPTSAASAASVLESSWNAVMAQVNSGIMPESVQLNLDIYETAAIFDGLTDVTLSVADGTATLAGTLEDTQTAAVLDYYADNTAGLETLVQTAVEAGMDDETGLDAYTEGAVLLDTAKFVEVTFPVSILTSGTGEFRYQIYRTYTFTEGTLPAETTTSETETTVTETTTTETETTVAETETSTEDEDADDDTHRGRKHRRHHGHKERWHEGRCDRFAMRHFGIFRTDHRFGDFCQPAEELEQPCERPEDLPHEEPMPEHNCKELEELHEAFREMIPWQK